MRQEGWGPLVDKEYVCDWCGASGPDVLDWDNGDMMHEVCFDKANGLPEGVWIPIAAAWAAIIVLAVGYWLG